VSGKSSNVDPREIELVFNYVENFIITNQRFCSTKDIAEGTAFSRNKVDRFIKYLIAANKLRVVYEVPRKVRLVAPSTIVDGFSQFRTTVPWMSKHSFPKKLSLEKERDRIESQLKDFDQFEHLLTSTGRELVNAVAHSLRWLGFEVKVREDEGKQDIEARRDDYLAILEVKGLEGMAKIDDLRQAVDYHGRKLKESPGTTFETVLLVNHFRLEEPQNRNDPFSQEVLEAVRKYYKFVRLLTTLSLYCAIGQVISKSSSKSAVWKQFRNGELDFLPLSS
jgi:predicted DNA-binding transcriptional regulator AlpA